MVDRETEQMAATLSALGNPLRLAVFRRLVKAGKKGMTFGRLAQELELAPSTLAHHLAALAQARMIEQEKAGRETLNRTNFEQVSSLLVFLMRECCTDMAVPDQETGA